MSLTSQSHMGRRIPFFPADLNTSCIRQLLNMTLPKKIVLQYLGRQIGTFASTCFKVHQVSKGINITDQHHRRSTSGERRTLNDRETRMKVMKEERQSGVKVRGMAVVIHRNSATISVRPSVCLPVLLFPHSLFVLNRKHSEKFKAKGIGRNKSPI